eukprot:TRINITY_DN3248_c0_g1_i9.p1 TRINITY_DN3248_c0_g1~~TRINITY_DN3248_c0_g1_i9.p1  ORF type:complete len:654 (-),score=229.40 TRINITY_DN3248_c0_g1_i9:38-1999(-)
MIVHGRLYISGGFLSFFGSVFGILTKIIPLLDVIDIQKKNTAVIFPNAIEVTLFDNSKLLFTSFLFRDQAFQIIHNLWKEAPTYIKRREKEKAEQQDKGDQQLNDDKGSEDGKEDPLDGTESITTDMTDDPLEEQIPFDESEEEEGEDGIDDTSEPIPEATEKKIPLLDTNLPLMDSPKSDSESHRPVTTPKSQSDAETKEDRKLMTQSSNQVTRERRESEEADSKSDSELKSERKEFKNGKIEVQLEKRSETLKVEKKPEKSKEREKEKEKEVEKEKTKEKESEAKLPKNSSEETPETPIPISEKCNYFNMEEIPEMEFFFSHAFAITIVEFFNLFLGTSFWAHLHQIMGYTENTFGKWALTDTNCCIKREFDFVSPIVAKIGPKSTRVISTQVCRYKNRDTLAFEAKSDSKNVPYGDSFSLINRFIVKKDPAKKKGCIVYMLATTKWWKNIWGPKGMIQTAVTDGGKDFCAKFLEEVKKKLSEPIEPANDPKTTLRKRKTSKKPEISSTASTPATSPPAALDATFNAILDVTSSTSSASHPVASTHVRPSTQSLGNLEINTTVLIFGGIVLVMFLFICMLWSRIASLEHNLKMEMSRRTEMEGSVDQILGYMRAMGNLGMTEKAKAALLDNFDKWRQQIDDLQSLLRETQN